MIFNNVTRSQNGDKQAMLWLVSKFDPALKKYARKLNTKDGYNDLVADFLDAILHINCTKIKNKNDGAMVNYLTHSIYHAYIKLMQKQISACPSVCIDHIPEQLLQTSSADLSDGCFTFDIPYDLLTKSERKILYLTEIQGYSAADVGRMWGTSRQNISRTRNRGLNKLRTYLTKSDQL